MDRNPHLVEEHPSPLSQPLARWQLRGRSLLPVVQGGMGIGVSAHSLAGNVARLGAVGTISSVDLRHHHPDLLAQAKDCKDKDALDRLNLTALDREIRMALELAAGQGAIAVNVMKAVSQYAAYVRQSCESGAHAIVMGAGLPFDLPDLMQDFPAVALIPILSDVRGVNIVLKKWMRKKRLPDAIVIEHPRYAGGIHTHAQVRALLGMGASAVQLGTPFAVTQEGDAHENFKHVLADAKPEDIVTFMSVAGLPARAVKTFWLENYLKREKALQSHAKADPRRCVPGLNCLSVCGLRDGIDSIGQFCIDTRLTYALKGDVKKGLFFRGSEPLPFGHEIRPVADLVNYLMTGSPTPP